MWYWINSRRAAPPLAAFHRPLWTSALPWSPQQGCRSVSSPPQVPQSAGGLPLPTTLLEEPLPTACLFAVSATHSWVAPV